LSGRSIGISASRIFGSVLRRCHSLGGSSNRISGWLLSRQDAAEHAA
jgi:hypothetical protein